MTDLYDDDGELVATDTFTDAQGRHFIAGQQVPEAVWGHWQLLAAERDRLSEALAPFVTYAEAVAEDDKLAVLVGEHPKADDVEIAGPWGGDGPTLTVGDLRRAQGAQLRRLGAPDSPPTLERPDSAVDRYWTDTPFHTFVQRFTRWRRGGHLVEGLAIADVEQAREVLEVLAGDGPVAVLIGGDIRRLACLDDIVHVPSIKQVGHIDDFVELWDKTPMYPVYRVSQPAGGPALGVTSRG